MDIRKILKLLEATDSNTKIKRDAFLYLSPKGDKNNFAQCSTCSQFNPETERCGLFGKDDKVIAAASCGLYIHGAPDLTLDPMGIVSPEEAGYVKGNVRCENCKWFENNRCDLFAKLNKELPNIFDLDEEVEAKACCNGWQ